jgi:single-stranded-DNA-specific exonuclease
MARLGDLLARQGAGTGGAADLRLDGVLMPAAATIELIEALDTAGPYGAGAPAPRFAFPDQPVRHLRRIGENHLRITFGGGDGTLEAVEAHRGARFHFAGRLEVNDWGGRQKPQLRLEDAAPSAG